MPSVRRRTCRLPLRRRRATTSNAVCGPRSRSSRPGWPNWRDEHLDPTLLAARSDIVAFLRGDDDARLASGWRNDMVGDGVRRLVGGEAGLTFDPQGRLRLTTVAD